MVKVDTSTQFCTSHLVPGVELSPCQYEHTITMKLRFVYFRVTRQHTVVESAVDRACIPAYSNHRLRSHLPFPKSQTNRCVQMNRCVIIQVITEFITYF